MLTACAPLRAEFSAYGGKSTHSHAVGDRVGALPIEMLGGNEFRLREVGGFAANFNRANRRGNGFAVFDARSARSVFSAAHVAGKNGFDSISQLTRRNSARLMIGFGNTKGAGLDASLLSLMALSLWVVPQQPEKLTSPDGRTTG